MAYAETVKTVGVSALGTLDHNSVLTAGDKVRAYVASDGHGKVFDPTLGGTVATDSANLPSVGSVSQVTYVTQDVLPSQADTSTQYGPVHVFLQNAALDVVNAPSVQSPWLDANALVVVATGNG